MQASRSHLVTCMVLVPLMWLSLACCAWADVTDSDYRRAEDLLPGKVDSLLLNDRVIPHWVGTRDEFWYLHRSADGGHDFVLVDATTGHKKPAFDHDALAAALARVTQEPVSAADLPFTEFSPVGRQGLRKIQFEIAAKEYVCSLSPANCEAVGERVDAGVLRSPDGKWGVFTRESNLWLRNLKTGEEHALTADGAENFGYGIYPDGWKAEDIPRERSGKQLPPLESYWSPDSAHVIVSHVDQRNVAVYPYVETVPADGSFRPKLHPVRIPLVGEQPGTLDWFVFDILAGTHRRIEYPYDRLLGLQQDLLAVRQAWWDPSGAHLYAVAFGANMESAYLFDSDLATGKVRTVIEERALPRVDLNSTSYNQPNVHVTADGREAIWFSERDGWGHLYLYDVRSGELKNRITSGAWLVRDLVQVDEKGRRIYFTAAGRERGNPYYRYLYGVNFDGSGLTLLSPEEADHLITGPRNLFALDGAVGYDVISPSGRFAVYNTSSVAQPSSAVIRRTSDGREVALFERGDASRLFAAGYQSPEEFTVKAADGKTDLYGVIYKPPHFDPTHPYPVIDAQYASPLTAVVPRNFVMATHGVPGLGNTACFAQLGFVVVVVDARGTAYRSREFSQHGQGQLNINGLDDHVAALRQLAQRFPYIDASKVGITGTSFGGWTAVRAMLEFPDFYKVAVAGVPPGSAHNMYLDYHWTTFQGRPHYRDGSESRPAPGEVPDNYVALDARRQAARLRGKLLIVLGELDENVPPGSTLQLVDALMKANRDFDLLYLPGLNHHQSGTPYVIRRTWDFFVRNLLGTEPPRQYEMHR